MERIMDNAKFKQHLPTLSGYIEKRRKAKHNQLPKHLRPVPTWPIGVQLLLNAALIVTLYNMMVDREEYLTEAGPAVLLIVCLLLLIYTFISAFQLKRRFPTGRAKRFTTLNFWLMILAFIFWCGSIMVFIS